MAVAFDASSQASSSGSVNSLTWAHTCTGTDRILIVLFGENTGTPSQSTVTYDGVSMTAFSTVSSPFANNKIGWYLINPASGANNIVATRTTTSTAVIRGVAASYTGAKQSGQPDAQNTFNVASSTSGSAAITPVADNCWHIVTYNNDSSSTVSAGASTTRRQANTGDASMAILDSNAPITAGVSNSLNFTTGVAVAHYGNTFSIAPSVAASASGNFFAFM